jgi:hypothetical protein
MATDTKPGGDHAPSAAEAMQRALAGLPGAGAATILLTCALCDAVERLGGALLLTDDDLRRALTLVKDERMSIMRVGNGVLVHTRKTTTN